MTVRTLVVAGVSCLAAAALLMIVFLPREFSVFPDTAFRTKVISSSPARDGVAVAARSDDTGAVIVEWKATP